MRLFQNAGVYRSYRPRLAQLSAKCETFDEAVNAFLNDRFNTGHFLQPILDKSPDAFFANGDEEFSQQLWAKAQGMSSGASLDDILRAQIEHHRTEIFYNTDPMRYGDSFLDRLPGCVRKTVAWRAAPSKGGNFLKHDVIVNNFPSLLKGYRALGMRAEYFAPGHDPVMDQYASRKDRPVDILFVGTYSRHHRARALILETIAELRGEMNVVFHLDTSRLTKLAETPAGWIGPLRKERRSRDIRAVTKPPAFGRELLDAIGNAKIVVNGAIDMAGEDRGNMRVWEAMGCGAALVSDAGRYPDPMRSHEHFLPYRSPEEAVSQIRALCADPAYQQSIAKNGHAMIATEFSKARQWSRFVEIVG